MARMSIAASLMGLAATALLSGCASSGTTAAGSAAFCSGTFLAFGEATSQDVSLTCDGVERDYVAYPESIAHRYSPCTYTFDSSGSTGSGRLTCSSGRSGPLSYDRTDPNNIKVAATLDDGREMNFTLRQE
jgi:hypothetical protein